MFIVTKISSVNIVEERDWRVVLSTRKPPPKRSLDEAALR
jgi:hypothetical protein